MAIKSYKELEKVLTKAVTDGMKEADFLFEDVVERAITDVVYNSYDPTSYKRSYALRRSIDSKIKGTRKGVELEIYHDKSEMSHTSIITGEKVHNLPYIVHEGMAGRIFGGKDYPFYAPRPYMKRAEEEINKRGVDLLRTGLSISGYETISG